MRKSLLTRIITLSTALSLSLGLVVFNHAEPTKVEAEAHLTNYDPYTYAGEYYPASLLAKEGGGLNSELRTALTDHIKPDPEGFYKYTGGSGSNYLSTQLQSADEDPTNSNNMVYFYTRDSVSKNAAETWNREHVWCQSLSNGNWGEKEGGTDLLHIRPTYSNTNSSRGNLPYGDLNKANPKYFDPSIPAVVDDNTKMPFGYQNASYFEPLDYVKGDVARIIMYMWTAYNGWEGEKTYTPLSITDIIESYDTLLRWHTMDKPDVLEGHRNDYCESSNQANRNPFVDHPEFAWKIFGNEASTNVKNACMAAYPSGEIVAPTDIALNKESALLEVGNTLELTPSFTPNNAFANITWTSSNNSVATVNNGLVTAISEGTATITARVSQNIYATCFIRVGTYPKVASYDFNSGNASTSEYNANGLYNRFDQCANTTNDLSNIVTSVTDVSKTYAGYASYYTYGLKLGTSSSPGSFTLSLNKEVAKVVVKVAGWTTSDSIIVGDASAQTPGVAYTANNAIKTLTFYITPSDDVTFTIDKRGYIQTIDFYGAEEAIIGPERYLTSTSFATLQVDETSNPGESHTISKAITQFTGDMNDGERLNPISLDETINVSVNADGNNGKVYNSGKEWRLYQTNNAIVTVAASNGALITSVTFTFNVSNTGILRYDENVVTSGSPVNINSLSSVNFDVSNSTSATNGQVRVTNISVTYLDKGTVTINSVSMQFGASIFQNNWTAINDLDDYEITDYGVMLVKKNTLANTYKVSSIEEAHTNQKTLYIVNRGSGDIPYESGNSYSFAVQLNITRESNYSTVYVAAPFIKVNETYYFLDEVECSINSLAQEYLTNGGSTISDDALTILKGNN